MQVNEGEGLSKRDRFPELLDLVKKGNRAFRENRMEEVKFFVFLIYNFIYGPCCTLLAVQLHSFP